MKPYLNRQAAVGRASSRASLTREPFRVARRLTAPPDPCSWSRPGRHGRAAEGGFASVIVIILVFVVIALLLGNNRVLYLLKKDLQRVEERQAARSAGRIKPTPSTPAQPQGDNGVSEPDGEGEAGEAASPVEDR